MKKVVTLGGGTGSFVLLSGLKQYPIRLSAIVSMADDGGSTGVLRDELGVLPPGDVRQCLVALSDSPLLLRELMKYRFEEGGLSGHSFGNLFLSALEKVTGNFSQAVREASRVLNVRGEVIPVTETGMHLFIELRDGTVLSGEHMIDTSREVARVGVRRIFCKPQPKVNPLAIKRIFESDLVVIGPGGHYTSIVPNLLVPGIADAIRDTKAKVVYNCNLVNKIGQTDGWTLEAYVESINDLLGGSRIDFVTFNTRRPPATLLTRYASEGTLVDERGKKASRTGGYRVLYGDFLHTRPVKRSRSDAIAATRSFIRHDGDKLAKVLVMLPELSRYERILRSVR